MKNILLLLTVLVSVKSLASVTTITLAEKASALAQIADQNLAGDEATTLIHAVLDQQSYNNRVSLMSTSCEGTKHTKSCSIQIGEDDTTDDDNGWGAVYRLDFTLDEKGTVILASLELIAG